MIKMDIKGSSFTIETSRNYHLSELVLVLLNGILFSARKAVEKQPEEVREDFKKSLYDLLNLRFSGLLEEFAPEYELRPGLTEKALMKLENEVLEDEMSKM